MSYAVIVVNPDTTRIESGRLYDVATADNEYEVESLPNGNLTDYLYVDGEYVYDHIKTQEEIEQEEAAANAELEAQVASSTYEMLVDHEYRICMMELTSGVTA